MPGFDGTGPLDDRRGGRGRGRCGCGGAMGGGMGRGSMAGGGRGRRGIGPFGNGVEALPQAARQADRTEGVAGSDAAEIIQHDLAELKARQRELDQRLQEMRSLDDTRE